jgi:hypothetical protein
LYFVGEIEENPLDDSSIDTFPSNFHDYYFNSIFRELLNVLETSHGKRSRELNRLKDYNNAVGVSRH